MIKQILDEIKNESSTNQKMVILAKYKTNDLLKQVLYLACSKRVKFYIKQIPRYTPTGNGLTLEQALIRLNDLSTRKYTGEAASDFLYDILNSLTADDGYVIERIIDKDLKIGMGSNINKVFPKLIEETPYMGAKPFDTKLVKDLFVGGKSCFIDVKMDGRYNNAIIRSGEVELESRSGETVILENAKFLTELAKFPDCVLNGELTIAGVDRYKANGMIISMIDIIKKQDTRPPAETYNKLLAFEKENNCTFQEALDRIIYTVWDIITIDEYFDQESKTPYEKRWTYLKFVLSGIDAIMVQLVEKTIVKSYDEAIAFFQDCLNRGLEGSIVKSMDGKWKDGKPKWQIKMKLEMDLDLQIIGFAYGTKGTKNENVISTLECQSADGILKANPAGMDEATMDYVTKNQNSLLNTIVHVKCSGISKDSNGNFSLLHPRIGEQKFRDDKKVADTLVQIQAIEAMCKGLA
jgi:DNA ligase-1